MQMDGLTLDQVRVLLAVIEQGSFSGGARALNRAQSAVTHAIQRLEGQLGVALFDRTGYRPVLTGAGQALLPRARRLVEEAAGLRTQARGIAGGLEAELTVAVEALFPMEPLLEALHEFSRRYPSVTPRLYVEALGAAAGLVLDGTCALGLLPDFFSDSDALARRSLLSIELVTVAAPNHPLALIDGLVPPEMLREHVQLVLTDRSGLTGSRDYGVLASRTWRLGDLGAKHTMLRAGLGWGNMPRHMVEDDLAHGTLRLIRPDADASSRRLPMSIAWRADDFLGPATTWMAERLAAASQA
jgi:DNA-binding transcriptional LysR family regulator